MGRAKRNYNNLNIIIRQFRPELEEFFIERINKRPTAERYFFHKWRIKEKMDLHTFGLSKI